MNAALGTVSTPPALLERALDDPAAWTAAQMSAAPGRWIHELDAGEREEVLAAVAHARGTGKPLLELTADDVPMPALAARLAALRAVIEGGIGFHLLRGLPVDALGEDGTRIAFWGLGCHLGFPEPQDGAGNLLHDVRDTGRAFADDASLRKYQTSERIDFHNDGADAFMLCMVRGAVSGGESLLVSAVSVFNEIVRTRPDLARVLQQDFVADTRGQRRDGAKVQVMPVFNFHAGHLTANLKKDYILSAQRFDDVPRLTPAQREALDLLDDVCGDPRFCLEFRLRPGDVEIGNNYVTFHARRAFRDAAPGAGGRHLLRLWLSLPDGRALPPCFEGSREFGATWARRGGGGASAAPRRPPTDHERALAAPRDARSR